MARAASAAIAFSGLCVGTSAAVLLSFLTRQPPPGAVDDGAQQVAAHVMLAAVATFFTAVTVIYVRLRDGGGGAGARRFPEVMLLILCASVGLLDLALCMQAGPVQAPLRVAAVQLLPHAAAATFYLSLVLTYMHVRAATGGAGNERYPAAAVELLKMTTLAATLVTGVLSSITAALVFDTK